MVVANYYKIRFLVEDYGLWGRMQTGFGLIISVINVRVNGQLYITSFRIINVNDLEMKSLDALIISFGKRFQSSLYYRKTLVSLTIARKSSYRKVP